MNVKKKETTGHQRQQDIINVARRVTMLMNTGQLEQGDVAEMTAFLLDLGVMTVKKEVREECGLEVDALEKVGVLQFEFVGQPPVLEVHVFGTSCFTGEPVDTEEMSPKWFSIGEVPFDRMWPDDRIWFPMYLGDKKFQGHFLYEGLDHIRSHTLVVVEDHLPN